MLNLQANSLFVTRNVAQTVSASGGTAPYVYSVVAGGAGGSINSSTGKYTAPAVFGRDTIRVTDDNADTADIIMRIMPVEALLLQIIQSELGLANGRVWLWNQKVDEPKDEDLYIVGRVMSCRPFANRLDYDYSSGVDAMQSVSMKSTLSIDIKSRGTEALYRKEEVVMALASQYAEQQQALNSFKIGKVPMDMPNIGEIDGSAIPYRFNITVNLLYSVSKTKAVGYFDDFQDVSVVTDP
jgi:hypothetical protein